MKVMKKQDILASIPADWKIIAKQEYALFGVHPPADFELVAAYKTPSTVVSIISYENIDGFLEEYNKQFQLIKQLLKGKNWKEISPINPLAFGYEQMGNAKFYVSVFEAYNSPSGVSVQLFYEGDYVMGMNTSIAKPKEFSLKALADQEPVIAQIVSMFQ